MDQGIVAVWMDRKRREGASHARARLTQAARQEEQGAVILAVDAVERGVVKMSISQI
jgi:hypothetical protein